MNHKRLLENKMKVAGGDEGWALGIKEGTCWNEVWVLCVSDESLNSTPETNNAQYVNQLEFK